jgi:predicted GIY-YIG superfamily endonuclease
VTGFHYVYILTSAEPLGHYYIGLTANLAERLGQHNRGLVAHTSAYRRWKIKTAMAFRDRERAAAFEKYLKSGSGRAFAKTIAKLWRPACSFGPTVSGCVRLGLVSKLLPNSLALSPP